MKASVDWENPYPNSKYTLSRMIDEKASGDLMTRLRKCHSLLDLCMLYDLKEYYEEHFKRVGPAGEQSNILSAEGRKRAAAEEDDEDEARMDRGGGVNKKLCVREETDAEKDGDKQDQGS